MIMPYECAPTQIPQARRYYEIAVWKLVYSTLSTVACTVASGLSFFFSPLISRFFVLLLIISLGVAGLSIVACVAIVFFGILRYTLRGLLFSTLTLGAMLALMQSKSDSLHGIAWMGFFGLVLYWGIEWLEAFDRLDRMGATPTNNAPTNSLPDNPSKTSPTAVGPS
jgi:hypothetical protein